jgi:membrane-associated protein
LQEFFSKLIDLLFNLGDDAKWSAFLGLVGLPWVYGTIFLIIFAETGLVIMPFLPGDSLLFAIGAISTRDVGINLPLAMGLLIAAALLGDNLNYWIGRKVGPAVFKSDSRWLNKKHLARAHEFYEKHGPKMVVLARFVVIIRTFAPFVAGVARMDYPKFLFYSFFGAVLWVTVCCGAGYLLGNVPFVKNNFEYVLLFIISLTIIPVTIEIIKARKEKAAQNAAMSAT